MKCLHLLCALILVVMGDFKGHALPGFFLITLGIWWTTKCVLKYAFKKQKRTSYYDSKALFCRIDLLEGIVLAGMALIGEWSFSLVCLLSWSIFTCKEKIEYQEITKINFLFKYIWIHILTVFLFFIAWSCSNSVQAWFSNSSVQLLSCVLLSLSGEKLNSSFLILNQAQLPTQRRIV